MLPCGIFIVFVISLCRLAMATVTFGGNPAAATLPNDVQLSGAIVAAVEEDVAREEADEQHRQQAQEQLNWLALERMYNAINQGRGKLHKQRKMMKYLYPLLVGVVIAKAVLIPLILKMLTALSTTSFVMSKMALIAAGLLALRWIFSAPTNDKTHLEILHVPAALGRPHPYQHPISGASGGGGGGGGVGGSWEDLTLSGSNLLELTAKQPRQKYIPVMAGIGGNNGDAIGVVGAGNYRHPQHNYIGAAYEGKPFL